MAYHAVVSISPTFTYVLVLAHTAHVHCGSNVCPSLALPVEGLETPFAVAIPAGVAHPLHGIYIAH